MIYQLVDVWILDCSGFHAGFLAIAHPRSFMALAPFARNPRGFLFLIPPATRVFYCFFSSFSLAFGSDKLQHGDRAHVRRFHYSHIRFGAIGDDGTDYDRCVYVCATTVASNYCLMQSRNVFILVYSYE